VNILLLTPERTGNTLLHRLLTIYMNQKSFDKPVINIHELVNGLETYYNTTFNLETLKKTPFRRFDKLSDIANQIKSVDHYVTVNLAQYHIEQRQDSLENQLSFYEFLNENFYIIGCRRDNLFEYALSSILKTFSLYGNTFYPLDKVVRYQQYNQTPITVDRPALYRFLDRYKAHIDWSEKYFDIRCYFDYDKHIDNIEDFILSLDFMKNGNTWEDMFGISWPDWNACHRLIPNLVLHKKEQNENTKTITFASPRLAIESSMNNVLTVKSECNMLQNYYPADSIIQQIGSITITENEYRFLGENLIKYKHAFDKIQTLIDDGMLSEGVPMKLQSLGEKQKIIKNFEQCLEWYNEWVTTNAFGKEYTNNEISTMAVNEEQRLNLPLTLQLTR